MNQKAAELNNERLHNEAVQSEIYAILCQSGPMHCGAVADKIGMSPWKTREHLVSMVDSGEIGYNWLRGYSV